jgi:hypothetical protein
MCTKVTLVLVPLFHYKWARGGGAGRRGGGYHPSSAKWAAFKGLLVLTPTIIPKPKMGCSVCFVCGVCCGSPLPPPPKGPYKGGGTRGLGVSNYII